MFNVPVNNFSVMLRRSHLFLVLPVLLGTRLDLKFNTRYIVLWSNSLCLNVLGDSDPLSLRVMCVRDISIAGWGLERLHSIHIKARKA